MVEVQPSLGPATETASARDEQSDGMGRRKRERERGVYVVRIKKETSVTSRKIDHGGESHLDGGSAMEEVFEHMAE